MERHVDLSSLSVRTEVSDCEKTMAGPGVQGLQVFIQINAFRKRKP